MSALLMSVVHVALGCGAHVWGTRVGRAGRFAAFMGLAIGLPLMILRWSIVVVPSIVPHLFPFRWYGAVHPWWGFPIALFILGIAAARRKSERVVRWGASAATLVVCAVLTVTIVGLIQFDPQDLLGRQSDAGLCPQTTNYSCGAAAAATLLQQIGVPSTEREMAVLCGTNPIMGTDPVSVRWGLEKKLEGDDYEVSICDGTEVDLLNGPKPAMALVRHSRFLDHWVVVLEADENKMLVADPAAGRRLIRTQEFMGVWRGVLVRIERPSPMFYAWRPVERGAPEKDKLSALLVLLLLGAA